MDQKDLSFELMDIDRSVSSTSKMDISCAATDDDVSLVDVKPKVFVVDDEDLVQSYAKFKIPDDSPVTRPKSSTPILKPPKIEIKQEPLDNDYIESNFKIKNRSGSPLLKQARFRPYIPKSTGIKKYHIKLEQPEKKVPTSRMAIIVLTVVTLLLSVLTYQIMNMKCMQLDLEKLQESFSKNLFGQPIASKIFIESLTTEDKSKIIVLYGGTGVGKTYAVSMIMEQLWDAANMYHYTMPMFSNSFSPELMMGLTLCRSTFLIVDDLSYTDTQVTKQIENIVTKSENLGKSITIILVYNCDRVTEGFNKKCDDSFLIDLSKQYEHIKIDKEFIKFQPLTEEVLKKCIVKEFGSRIVNQPEINNIMKNFNVSFDGCKGVYKKIKFLNVK